MRYNINMQDVLLQFGAVGAVLLWFMSRYEKKAAETTKALNNNTLAVIYLIEVISGCPNNNSTNNPIRAEEIKNIKQQILSSN